MSPFQVDRSAVIGIMLVTPRLIYVQTNSTAMCMAVDVA